MADPPTRVECGGVDLGEGLPGRRIYLDAVLLEFDGVSVDVLIVPGLPTNDMWQALYDLRIADEVGTDYIEQSGGFMPVQEGPSRSHRSFRPEPPPSATELRVTLCDEAGSVIGESVVALPEFRLPLPSTEL